MEDHSESEGIAEISQQEIEQRALQIAKQAGREQLDAADLEQARTEILGTSSPQNAHLPTTAKPHPERESSSH